MFLTTKDLMVLENNEPLTDALICTALVLLKRQFPDDVTEEVVVCHSSEKVTIPEESISLIKVNNSYWVCCSKCSENTIGLYDPTKTNNNGGDHPLINQLQTINAYSFKPNPEPQCPESNQQDSGLYAIAIATVLCYSKQWYENNKLWMWNINKMRIHLKKCVLEYNLLTPFPYHLE